LGKEPPCAIRNRLIWLLVVVWALSTTPAYASSVTAVAVTALAAETPLPGLFEAGGFSEEQREDVAEVRTAISRAFGADGDPQGAIGRIQRVEARIVERAGIAALPSEPHSCPDHWPPPCHWHCPLGPSQPCVPLPPVGPDVVEHSIDQALLVAGSDPPTRRGGEDFPSSFYRFG